MAAPVFTNIQLLKRQEVGAKVKADAQLQNTTLFLIPQATYKQVPLSHLVEFFEKGVESMLVLFVDPRTPAMNKRYKPVYHKGAAQLSLPRYWLSGLVQHDADELETWGDTSVPTRLLLRFTPARLPTPAAPTAQDFLLPGE